MKKVLAAFLVAVLALAIAIPVAIAAPAGPDLEHAVIYYAKGGIPGPPKPEDPKVYDYYELIGPSWDLSKYPAGLAYVIDPDGAPAGAVSEVTAAFEAWDAATSVELFSNAYTVDSSANPSLSAPDFVNTVSWRGIAPTTIVAMTSIWYLDRDGSGSPTAGDEFVDADMIFNALLPWGIDPDGEGPLKLTRAYDVRNVATHEAGHVVGLDDLYADAHSELTMYGYTKKGETKKISLEIGDIHGTQALYGK